MPARARRRARGRWPARGRQLLGSAETAYFAAGAAIARHDSPADSLMAVVAGIVRVEDPDAPPGAPALLRIGKG